MKAKGLDYSKLARKAGVTRPFISNIAHGKMLDAKVDWWNKVLKVFDKTYDDLLIEAVTDYLKELSQKSQKK